MLNTSILLEDSARDATRTGWRSLGDRPPDLRRARRRGQPGGQRSWPRAGIEPGDRVALTCPNLPYFPIVYYGILKAGAVPSSR